MSESAPERPPARSSGGSRENVLTHRLGPLPTWVWIGVIGLGIIAWSWWKNKSASAASAANTAASSTPADQVPQFVNQTYTTVSPPSVQVTTPAAAPATTPAGAPAASTPTPIREPGPRPVAPKPSQPPIFNSDYVVKKGETLNSIAKRLGISRVDLAHANGLGTGAGLRTGQVIKVPSPAPGGTPNKAQ